MDRLGLACCNVIDRVEKSKYPFAFALRIRSHPNDRYSREADDVRLDSVESKREATATGQSVRLLSLLDRNVE